MQFDNNQRDLKNAEDLFQFLATLSAEQRKNLPLQLMVSDDELHEGTFSANAFSHPDEDIRGLRIETQL
ncbi:hypothetical protein D3C87_1122170 [compost metagenome]